MSQLPTNSTSTSKASAPSEAVRRTPIRAYNIVKRVLDILASLWLILSLSPFFLLIAVAITLESRGPVFFLQQRLGLNGKKFGLFKFRTLARKPSKGDEQGSVMALTGHDQDITNVGGFLRNSGLNELPQLLNILRGEMSFIGPRPAVLHHEQYYTDWHRQRLDVLPGVTGLAQVCGRNVIPWGWRVVLDRYYVEHMGFWLDLQIMLKTAYVVFFHIGCEGDEDDYFDFDEPTEDILVGFRKKGIMRTFLRK